MPFFMPFQACGSERFPGASLLRVKQRVENGFGLALFGHEGGQGGEFDMATLE